MAEPDGSLVELYAIRNDAMKSGSDVAAANQRIADYIEQNKTPQDVRRASSRAASNTQNNSRGGMAAKKAAMQKGGMANGKAHMYSGGGSVTDRMNPGLKALAKKRPDVVANILK